MPSVDSSGKAVACATGVRSKVHAAGPAEANRCRVLHTQVQDGQQCVYNATTGALGECVGGHNYCGLTSCAGAPDGAPCRVNAGYKLYAACLSGSCAVTSCAQPTVRPGAPSEEAG
jgi:hypothetical protein